MGQILDLVPNHMGVDGQPTTRGGSTCSRTGRPRATREFFDIDWEPVRARARAARCWCRCWATTTAACSSAASCSSPSTPDAATFSVHYYEHRFPVDPRAVSRTSCERRAWRLAVGSCDADARAGRASRASSPRSATCRRATKSTATRSTERSRDKEVAQAAPGATLVPANPRRRARASRQRVRASTAAPDEPRSFDRAARAARGAGVPARLLARGVGRDQLSPLLRHQRARRPAHGGRGGLRRDAPAGARPGRARAGRRTAHRPSRRAVRSRASTFGACRIASPTAMRARAPQGAGATASRCRSTWSWRRSRAGYERLPGALAGARHHRLRLRERASTVSSSTRRPRARIDRIYHAFRRRGAGLRRGRCTGRKSLILRTALASELNVLANQLGRIARGRPPHARLHAEHACVTRSREVVACFPVYRTYVADSGIGRRPPLHRLGVSRARQAAQPCRGRRRLRLRARRARWRDRGRPRRGRIDAALAFALKFQQFTAPVMAKGVEDTAFYRYNRLVVAERGRRRSAAVRHHASQPSTVRARTARRSWPHTLLATSTHDNKRGEDVRARINVLSETAAAWRLGVAALEPHQPQPQARRRRTSRRRRPTTSTCSTRRWSAPGRWTSPTNRSSHEFRERIQRYMLKAVREAKVHTSWINPTRSLRGGVDRLRRARC